MRWRRELRCWRPVLELEPFSHQLLRGLQALVHLASKPSLLLLFVTLLLHRFLGRCNRRCCCRDFALSHATSSTPFTSAFAMTLRDAGRWNRRLVRLVWLMEGLVARHARVMLVTVVLLG